MRYQLIDRIDELKKFSYAVGTKCISLTEDCFDHHVPGQLVYPGSLLLEAMAQLGGALLELSLRDVVDSCPRCVMSTVKGKFREFVGPGDTLSLRAVVVSRKENSAVVRITGTRDDDRVCEAEVLYVFLRVQDRRLLAARDEVLTLLTRSTRIVES